jgi:hypothetical protein
LFFAFGAFFFFKYKVSKDFKHVRQVLCHRATSAAPYSIFFGVPLNFLEKHTVAKIQVAQKHRCQGKWDIRMPDHCTLCGIDAV